MSGLFALIMIFVFLGFVQFFAPFLLFLSFTAMIIFAASGDEVASFVCFVFTMFFAWAGSETDNYTIRRW